MISFMILVVPPKIDRALLSRQSHNRAGEHRGSALAQPRPELSSGQREPRRSRDVVWAAITRQGIISPRRNSPSRGVAPTTTPNQRPRISQPSTRTSTPVSSSRHSCQAPVRTPAHSTPADPPGRSRAAAQRAPGPHRPTRPTHGRPPPARLPPPPGAREPAPARRSLVPVLCRHAGGQLTQPPDTRHRQDRRPRRGHTGTTQIGITHPNRRRKTVRQHHHQPHAAVTAVRGHRRHPPPSQRMPRIRKLDLGRKTVEAP